MEIFSVPRITPVAQEVGFGNLGAWDLAAGWDASKKDNEEKLWKTLIDKKPWWVTMSPPRRMMSIMQNLNIKQQQSEKWQQDFEQD